VTPLEACSRILSAVGVWPSAALTAARCCLTACNRRRCSRLSGEAAASSACDVPAVGCTVGLDTSTLSGAGRVKVQRQGVNEGGRCVFDSVCLITNSLVQPIPTPAMQNSSRGSRRCRTRHSSSRSVRCRHAVIRRSFTIWSTTAAAFADAFGGSAQRQLLWLTVATCRRTRHPGDRRKLLLRRLPAVARLRLRRCPCQALRWRKLQPRGAVAVHGGGSQPA
jgi:hypothetical protein